MKDNGFGQVTGHVPIDFAKTVLEQLGGNFLGESLAKQISDHQDIAEEGSLREDASTPDYSKSSDEGVRVLQINSGSNSKYILGLKDFLWSMFSKLQGEGILPALTLFEYFHF
jgi:hypothetical protein